MLTAKQELFCQEYLIDLIATKAYMRAYEIENYNSAASMAHELLSNTEVNARVKELMAERVSRANLNQDWVLARLQQISDRSMQATPVMEWDPALKEMRPTGEYEYDSNGANKATELIGKHMGMFKDKIEHSGAIEGMPIIIQGQKFADKDGDTAKGE